MSKHRIRTKISLQLLITVVISLGLAVTAGFIFARLIFTYVIASYGTAFIVMILCSWILGIGMFIVIFLLLIHRKINYLKYVSKKVHEIANKGFGATIKINGHDEIAVLGENINLMSLELERKFNYERELERSKHELISSVSHDLRTPLTSVKGYIKLLKDKQYHTTEEMERFIDIAFSKTEMLEDLIEELFEYTRLTGAEIKFNYQELCLNDIVKQVVMDYGPLFQKEGLDLQASIPRENFCVKIDPTKFVRVIENLLGNAMKYSLKPGEVWVKLSSHEQGVKMTIGNKGQAIDANNLDHLFERFYRLEKSRSKETGGTGLGLAIAKSIVELHAGRIWAESENDIICFHVWLPQIQVKTVNTL